MRTLKTTPPAAVLALVLGAFAAPGAGQEPPPRGSEAPCAVPLRWRVTRVDREFGFGIEEATAAVRAATALWERGVRQQLFVHDETAGFPIRLVYDERQAAMRERQRLQEDLERTDGRIEAERHDLRARFERLGAARALHNQRQSDFENRLNGYNTQVRQWNERGGAPPDIGAELGAAGEALAVERQEISRLAAHLETEGAALVQDQERLNAAVALRNAFADAIQRDFPPAAVKAGEYREAVQRVGGRIAGISREIRIYRFSSQDELRLTAAHELGHALGLGHARGSDAVMGEEHDSGGASVPVTTLSAGDLEVFDATCPGLRGGRS